ncbi:MAG TPA: DUF5606 domain-containing protein [Saprospiraceae bacterium]|nr:DUF5606 domain-containing protein [Saprospiraceae bacterium]
MNLKDYLSVSGLPGVYRLVASRSNGLIIEDFVEGKRKFVSSRRHQFTPLESIAIYTDDGESTELKNVFQNMLEQYEDNPPVSPNAPSEEIREYFMDVLPTFDENRVHTGDIKKVIKWFAFMKEHDLFAQDTTTDEEE